MVRAVKPLHVARLLALAAILCGCAAGASAPPDGSRPTGMGASATAGPGPSVDRRHPSGIPLTFDGEPVLVGLAAVVHAQATTDATPFLVGGWFNDASAFTCSGGIGRDPSPLLSGCATGVGGVSPSVGSSSMGRSHVFWDGHALPSGRGPAIVRVHTHDARTADCRADSTAQCTGVLVVEEVLWTGDARTETSPLSVVEAVRKFEAINIITSMQTAPQGYNSLQRDLFTTPVDDACPDLWPHQVYELHGDPRFGLMAVFPDEASRASAQAALDPSTPGCAIDPRIERPGAALWAGHQNVLVLVYGEDARARTQGALDGTINPDIFMPFPPESLDESYRIVNDAEAARAAGNLGGQPVATWTSGNWGWYADDLVRRFEADALRYTIGAARPATEADVGTALWAEIEPIAVPGTARLYVVDHPAATDPALREEVVVALRLRDPQIDTWWVVVVQPPAAP